ncbi:MAG: NAD(P)H-binding protein [Gemmatimonadales bacterium]
MNDGRAVVLGATGAVGGSLVRELLASDHWAGVTILTRRPTDLFTAAPGASKLTTRVIDLGHLEREAEAAARGCQAAFCTMGVGQPRKISREEFWRVDVEYAAAFARGCKAAGVRHFSLLGAVGADPDSRFYYAKVKGMAERAVVEQRFERASFFRPSLLVTRDIRYGLQDRITQALFPLLSPLLPRRLHEIPVEALGRAMRLNAEGPAARASEILYYPEFVALLKGR